MVLIQFLLPLQDAQGTPFASELFKRVREELTARFGGVTAYAHAPARGAWLNSAGSLEVDEVVLVEVMVPSLNPAWWSAYKTQLKQLFS